MGQLQEFDAGVLTLVYSFVYSPVSDQGPEVCIRRVEERKICKDAVAPQSRGTGTQHKFEKIAPPWSPKPYTDGKPIS